MAEAPECSKCGAPAYAGRERCATCAGTAAMADRLGAGVAIRCALCANCGAPALGSSDGEELACAVCGEPCQTVYYKSLEEAQACMSPGSVCLAMPWGPGRRSLYFNLEADVDFCSAQCSHVWQQQEKSP